MKRVMLTVAYDGTNYSGWQIQPNNVTIEEVLNDHLSRLLGEEIRVIGASRTDAGVHALGNVAVFDTNARIPGEKISFAMNQRLPEDIKILDSREVAADFHPSKQKCRKIYEYKILNTIHPVPNYRLFTHFNYWKMDLSLMRKGAEYLVGEHDFASFCSVKTQALTTVRTVRSIDIQKDEASSIITIRITGDGFLYNMVRIIAGTLMEVAEGKYPPEQVKDILDARSRSAAGPTAPARGLTLIGMEFLEEKKEEDFSKKIPEKN